MRNLFLKVTFATVLSALLLSPAAQADRQGGGTLMVVRTFEASKFMALKVPQLASLSARIDVNSSTGEYVRFKAAQGDKIMFDYSWFIGAEKGIAEVTLDKAKANEQDADLIRALLESKATANWQIID